MLQFDGKKDFEKNSLNLSYLVVTDGLVDICQVVGLNFVKASVIVADFGHHRR